VPRPTTGAPRPDGRWAITERELVVQRWWVTDGYFPVPTDPTLARTA
jgi:hypothetical protein